MSLQQSLVCKYDGCKMIFQNPILLPCGQSICQHHMNTFNDKFKCIFCDDVHQIPMDGFEINQKINKLMNSYYETDALRKEIKESFDELNNLISDYEKISPEGFICDHIREMINDVDIHREELIKEIQEKSNEIIKKLKAKEDECSKNASKSAKINLEQFKSNELATWKHSFRMPDLKQEELNDLLGKMKEKLNEIENETKKYKDDLLMNEAIFFDKYEKSSSFGSISFYPNNLNVLSKNCGKLIKRVGNHFNCKKINSIQVDEISKKLFSSSDDKTIKI